MSHGDASIADGGLKDLVRLAETFGFHLVSLDVRQESSVHSTAVAEILAAAGRGDYAALDEAARLMLLAELIGTDLSPGFERAKLTDRSRETLEVFERMARLQDEVGPEAFGAYVISMTHTASHVLEVMFLAHLAGLARREGTTRWRCQIRIAPLFETIEDLKHIAAQAQKYNAWILADEIYSRLVYDGMEEARLAQRA